MAGGRLFTDQVAYLEGCKAVELANETFGFNGWSSSVTNITVDFLEKDKAGSYTIGVTAIVRVMLKVGSFHTRLNDRTGHFTKILDMDKGKGLRVLKVRNSNIFCVMLSD